MPPRRGSRFEALEPIRQGLREVFGAFAPQAARGLALRHGHGSQYMSHDFQEELAFLGIKSSPAFVRAPEGNGCVERFVRILKENLLCMRTFSTVEELRQALLEFQRTYNNNWIIQPHGYKTPSQVRPGAFPRAILGRLIKASLCPINCGPLQSRPIVGAPPFLLAGSWLTRDDGDEKVFSV